MKRILCVFLLVFLVGLGVGCNDKEAQAALVAAKAQAELEARNIEVIKTLYAELDKGNAEILLKLCAPDYRYCFPSNNTKVMSREDAVAMVKTFVAAMPDLRHQITDIFAVKDRVIFRMTASGTQTGDLEGMPASGNKMEVSAIIINRLKDGLIVEEFEEADMLGLYQQLGMELRPKAPAK